MLLQRLQCFRLHVLAPCSPSAASRASLARPATCGEHVSQARGMQSMTSGCSTCLHECSRGCRRCSLDGCAPLQPSKPAAQAAQLVHTTCSSCSSRGASCAQQMTEGTQISMTRCACKAAFRIKVCAYVAHLNPKWLAAARPSGRDLCSFVSASLPGQFRSHPLLASLKSTACRNACESFVRKSGFGVDSPLA